MSAPRGLRLIPRDEERATWCLRCQRLARIGVSPILPVESCDRCELELPAWRVRWGPWVLVLAALLFLALLAVGSEPLVHPGESAFPRPETTR